MGHEIEDGHFEAEIFLRRTGRTDEARGGFELPAVDANDARGFREQGDFVERVDFKKRLHSELEGELVEVAKLGGIEHIGHEENRIRAMRPGFEDLVVVDEEILPQHGLGERGA